MNCKFFNNKKCLYPNFGNKYFCVHHAGLVDNIRTEDFSDEVFFAPWIGINYERRNIFDKKILILGNSHYCDKNHAYKECIECGSCPKKHNPECCYSTIDSIGDYLPRVPLLALSVVGGFSENEMQYDENKCDYVRNSIAFYNFVQESLKNGSVSPSLEQCEASDKAFFEILEKLRPELIIALGTSHMFSDLPGNTNRNPEKWKCEESFYFEKVEIKNGYYILKDKSQVPIVFIRHPAARGSYDVLFWNKAIDAFIRR